MGGQSGTYPCGGEGGDLKDSSGAWLLGNSGKSSTHNNAENIQNARIKNSSGTGALSVLSVLVG